MYAQPCLHTENHLLLSKMSGYLYCRHGLPIFMNCYAFNPEGEDPVRTISTLSHGIADNMHGLDGVGLGIRGYGEHWVGGWVEWGCSKSLDVPVCEQALPWQMGPHGILQSVAPPCGEPPAPDEEQNSRSSCLCLCHMRLQAIELKPYSPLWVFLNNNQT